MARIKLLCDLIVLLVLSFVLVGCGGAATTGNKIEPESSLHANASDNSQEIKGENRQPIIEIWQELDGSVRVRGTSLYFRMYDDGMAEFDYILRKEDETGKPRHTFTIERTPLTKISDGESSKIRSLSDELAKSKGIKQEYKPVALTLDVLTKLIIQLKEKGTIRKKIVTNDADYDITSDEYGKKFPTLLVDLLKETQLVRSAILLSTVPNGEL